jgi:hypothetical protein
MSTQPELQPFDAPVLLVEARYRERTLCAQVLSSRGQRGFTVGRGRRADAPIDPRYLPAGLPANDNHTLVAPSAGGFVINLAPAMREHAERSASRIRIPCGEVVFDITAAAAPPPVPRSWLRQGWRDDARVTGAVALGMVLLLLLVYAVPSDPHALSLDDVGKELHMGQAIVIPAVVVEPPLPKDARGQAAGGGAPKVAASGPTGAAGDPKATRAEARRATKGPAKNQEARDVERYIRENTILAALDGPHSASVDAVFDSTRALGDHEKDVFGHMIGTEIADAFGAHGLGMHGTGAGAADTGKAMLGGPGGLGIIGLHHGGPGGLGLNGHGDRGLGPKPHHELVVTLIPPSVRGGLDKEIVRRVVRQHLNEVRYCYEQALVRQPSLAGRVVTQFTIANTGNVLVSVLQSSTLGAPSVESCIVTATRRWLYPAPSGGGIVTVTYPFQLAPAGG